MPDPFDTPGVTPLFIVGQWVVAVSVGTLFSAAPGMSTPSV
jgi:hypothetical protein